MGSLGDELTSRIAHITIGDGTHLAVLDVGREGGILGQVDPVVDVQGLVQ